MIDTILEISKTIASVVAIIIFSIYFCKQYIDKLNKKIPIGESVVKQNREDNHIFEVMEYYKELLKADRIMLFEFHNGQHYSNYRSALKLSVSYECYRAGLDSQRAECTNLPISIMPQFIHAITTQESVNCKDIEELKNTMSNTYSFKKSLGIRAFYDVPIRDDKGNIIGFVAVQWNREMPDDAENYRAIVDNHVKHLAWSLEESIKKITAMEYSHLENKRKLFKRK